MIPLSFEYLPILMKVIRLIHVILGYFSKISSTANILGTQGLSVFVTVSAPTEKKRNAPQKEKSNEYLHHAPRGYNILLLDNISKRALVKPLIDTLNNITTLSAILINVFIASHLLNLALHEVNNESTSTIITDLDCFRPQHDRATQHSKRKK